MRAKKPKVRRSVRKTNAAKQRNNWQTSQNQPQPTKTPESRIPPPQAARIVGRYIAGQSIREIARQENRARETVTRLARSEEVQNYVQRLRADYFALGPAAVDAVEASLAEGSGGLGRALLVDIGVIPSKEQLGASLFSDPVLWNRIVEVLKTLETPTAQTAGGDGAEANSSNRPAPNDSRNRNSNDGPDAKSK